MVARFIDQSMVNFSKQDKEAVQVVYRKTALAFQGCAFSTLGLCYSTVLPFNGHQEFLGHPHYLLREFPSPVCGD